MLFTSYSFLLFVLVVLALYYLVPKRMQWGLLLVASYLFYFFSGAENLIYILFTTVSTYILTIVIQKNRDAEKNYLKEYREKIDRSEKKRIKQKNQKRRWRWLLLCIILNIGMLAVVKYTNFTISNINSVLKILHTEKQLSFLDIALPMGISFYVFKTVSYAVDVYHEKYEAEKNPFKLALFISFFPELVQGPISRYGYLSQTLFEQHEFDKRQVSFGVQRILWGFFKKLVIADRILVGVNAIIHDPTTYRGTWVFVGMLFYALELYADFTGGIDITIGISEALGIRVEENFIRPYFSKNIKEYWNRWHITMGSWFTDYVFYPISVCEPMLKLSKKSRKRFGDKFGRRVTVYLSCITVWFATGIWHGASWNFIVWGLGNGIFILISQELEPFYRWFHKCTHVQGTLGWKMFQILRTNLLMFGLRTLDCYRDVPITFQMFKTMFTDWNVSQVASGFMELGLGVLDYGILIAGVLLLFFVSMIQRSGSVRERIYIWAYPKKVALWFGLFLVVLLFGHYGIGYDASQFIYNQF